MKTKGLLRAVAVLAVVILAGCATTRQVGVKENSGFLGDDYSLLKPAKGKYATGLMYVNPNADWAPYTKILLDPVTIWAPPKKDWSISRENAQRVANNFYKLIFKELAKDYEMVMEPGPNTIRTQIAITSVQKGSASANTITSLVPVTRSMAVTQSYAGDEQPVFAGDISVESKSTDSLTGELLAAAAARRVGSKNFYGSWDSWKAIDDSMEYWAELGRYVFCQRRGGKNCVKPKTEKGF